VDVINGITFINDSKSTKPESSIQALLSFPENKSIIILGGSKKGTNFRELCEVVKKELNMQLLLVLQKMIL